MDAIIGAKTKLPTGPPRRGNAEGDERSEQRPRPETRVFRFSVLARMQKQTFRLRNQRTVLMFALFFFEIRSAY